MKKHISRLSLCDIDLTALFFVVLFCCFSCLTYAQSKTAQNAKANSTGTKASQASNQTSSKKENANYKLSSQRIKTIEEIVDKYKTEGLSDEETVKKINAEIGQKMPLIPTEPLLKDDDATIKKLAQKKAEKEYGSLGTITSKLDAEAKKKFPLYKIGDRITLDYSANSRVYSVTGMLTRIAQKSVTVDEKRVNLIDLPETERAKFDASTNRIIRERYIDKQTQIEKQKLAEAEQKVAAQLKKDYAQQNEKAGYIYDSKRKKWFAAQDIIASSLNKNNNGSSQNSETKEKQIEENASVPEALNNDSDIPVLSEVIDFDSAYNAWYLSSSRRVNLSIDNFERRLFGTLGIFEEANRSSGLFDNMYAVWKEKNTKKTFNVFYKEIFRLLDKELSLNDIIKEMFGNKTPTSAALAGEAPKSFYYLDSLQNNYGYIIALDYQIYIYQKDYLKDLEQKDKDKVIRTFKALKARPELLVVEQNELRSISDVPNEIKQEIIKIRTERECDKIFLSIVARNLEGAEQYSHYVSYQQEKQKTLDNLLLETNKFQTKQVAKQYISEQLGRRLPLYIYSLTTKSEQDAAESVVSKLLKDPSLLLIDLSELNNYKSLSNAEKKEILRIRQSSEKRLMNIYWLFLLYHDFEEE